MIPPVPSRIVLALMLAFGLPSLAGLALHAAPATQGSRPNGRELFNTHCATCHGVMGAGNGPVAASMRKAPPDITGLSLANGGMFPLERVRRIVEGREVEAHGNREMPVWGDVFRTLEGGASPEVVRERIGAIVDYLRSMQRRLS